MLLAGKLSHEAQSALMHSAADALRHANFSAGVESVPFDDGFVSVAAPFVSVYVPDHVDVRALHAVAFLTGLQILQGPLGLWFLVS